MKISTVLVPTDFSESSFHAVRYGLAVARRFQARLHVLHVTREMFFYMPAFGGYSPSQDEYAAAATAFLEATIDGLQTQGVEVTTEHRFGRPGEVIVQSAQQMTSPLIILDGHDAGLLARTLSPSVTSFVVAHANCPVMTIPDALLCSPPATNAAVR
ncbi:MAG: universal stress protein [Planctomycetaceae bacterium]|nr:universal stress protein [Planctomycetaceae bacterium]